MVGGSDARPREDPAVTRHTGSLGSETDAVVIGMLNISEPTYLMVFNNTDYFGLDGVFYTPGEIRDDPALLAKVDFNGDGVEDIDLDPVPIHNIRYGVSGTFWTGPATIQPIVPQTRALGNCSWGRCVNVIELPRPSVGM